MNEFLKKVGNTVHGVKDAIESAQAVKEQVEALTDSQYMRLARKLDVDWRRGGTNSIMMQNLVDIKKKLAEVVDDECE